MQRCCCSCRQGCARTHPHVLRMLQQQPMSTAHQRGSTTIQRINKRDIWHGTLRCRTKCSRTPQHTRDLQTPLNLLLYSYFCTRPSASKAQAAPTFASAAAATISAGLPAQLQRASSCQATGLQQSSNAKTSTLQVDLATATAAATMALCARRTLHYCVAAHCCCCWCPTQRKPRLHYLAYYANWRLRHCQ
jgi:hypothetical protein